ncbi:PREDICTED: monocarboxylate transporter 3 [Myotis davidii]|uniref:monocarboxylate transporter 3 n=1 Tax=Myotis davidii TaxID=225400 RepID=UPI0007674B2C|nr:PREDICTED: monocarboxylate transporter 3 [Myotis davidii]
MAVATNCCLRRAQAAPPRPGTGDGARDSEDAEAEGDPEPLPAPEPSVPETLELLSPGAGPSEPEVEAEPGLDPESV